MHGKPFSIMQAFRFGFSMFARNFWLLIGLSILGLAVQFSAAFINQMIIDKSDLSTCKIMKEGKSISIDTSSGENVINITYNKMGELYNDVAECFTGKNMALTLLVMFIHLMALLFSLILLLGWDRIALDLVDRGTSEINRIFVVMPFLISYLIAAFLYSVIGFVGLLLFIIPGIIWGIKYSFFDLVIVDTGCGPLEALTESGNITYGHKWQLLWFAIVCAVLMVLSVITIIGPFILTYVFFLSRAYIYRVMQGRISNVQ